MDAALEELWNDRYQQLSNFREKFGHCNIDRNEYTKLAHWITVQRREYKKYQNGIQTTLTQDRIDKLKAIDFCFDVYQQKWENHLKQVLEFKSRYGHCRIPKKYQPNIHLGQWVRYVRGEHRRYEQGKKCALKKKHVDELESIGFFAKAGALDTVKGDNVNSKWKVQKIKLWNEMYQQLLKFKAERGHIIVPRDDPKYPKLGSWVASQRKRYKRCLNGHINSMSQDSMDKLKAIGLFCGVQHDALWVEHLKNLEEFKRAHGHVNVPHNYPPNQRLSNWTRSSRKKLRLYLDGKCKESQLTRADVASLTRIGLKPDGDSEDVPSSQRVRTRSAVAKRIRGRGGHSEDAPNSKKLRTRSAKAVAKTGQGSKLLKDNFDCSESCSFSSDGTSDHESEDDGMTSQRPITRSATRASKRPITRSATGTSKRPVTRSATRASKRQDLQQNEIRLVLRVADTTATIVSSTLEGHEFMWKQNGEDELCKGAATESSVQGLRLKRCHEEPDCIISSKRTTPEFSCSRKRQEIAQPKSTASIIPSSSVENENEKETALGKWISDASSFFPLQDPVTNNDDEDWDNASSSYTQSLGTTANDEGDVDTTLQRPRTRSSERRRHNMVGVDAIRKEDKKWDADASTQYSFHSLSTNEHHDEVNFICIV